MKRCGFHIRVSTDRQAKVGERSLSIECSEKPLTIGIRADRGARPDEVLNGLATGHVPASVVHRGVG